MIVCLVVWLFRGPDGRESRPLCSDVIFPFCTELVMMSEHDMQNRPDITNFVGQLDISGIRLPQKVVHVAQQKEEH